MKVFNIFGFLGVLAIIQPLWAGGAFCTVDGTDIKVDWTTSDGGRTYNLVKTTPTATRVYTNVTYGSDIVAGVNGAEALVLSIQDASPLAAFHSGSLVTIDQNNPRIDRVTCIETQ